MTPGLRRAIVDALILSEVEIVNRMDGTFEDGNILIKWRGRVYRLSAERNE